MTASLSPRQQALYVHTCDIWRASTNLTADGVPLPDSYDLIYEAVPCYFQYTANVDDPAEVGSFKRKTILTTDILHLPVEFEVQNGDWVKNTTPGNRNAGTIEVVQGAANILPGAGNRAGLNKQQLFIMSEEHPPQEIVNA